jgi:hypothetical protein
MSKLSSAQAASPSGRAEIPGRRMRLRAGRPQCHGKFRRRTVELVDTGADADRAGTPPAGRCAHCRDEREAEAIAVWGAGARASGACAGEAHALGRGTGQGHPARPEPRPGQINPPPVRANVLFCGGRVSARASRNTAHEVPSCTNRLPSSGCR